MNVQLFTTQAMQADHQNWLQQLSHWREENGRWQTEHNSAVSRLADLQRTIREHGECLEEHQKALQKIEDAVTAHEQQMGAQSSEMDKMHTSLAANHHLEQGAVFSIQKDAHARIKMHHDAVMEQLRLMESFTLAAM